MWCGDWDFVSELSKNVVAISKCSDDAGSKSLFRPSVFPFILEPSVNGRTKFCAGTDGPSWAGY